MKAHQLAQALLNGPNHEVFINGQGVEGVCSITGTIATGRYGDKVMIDDGKGKKQGITFTYQEPKPHENFECSSNWYYYP